MTDNSEKIKTELLKLRNRIKKFRIRMTGGVLEKNAMKTGADLKNYVDLELDKVEKAVKDLNNKFAVWIYKYKESLQLEVMELEQDIRDLRAELNEDIQELNAENIELKTKQTAEKLEKKFKNFIKKLRKNSDWDSDLDLIRDLK